MSNDSASRETVGGAARREHQAIRAALEAGEAVLKRLVDGVPDAERIGQVLKDLEGLSSQLTQHFAREEAVGGIFAQALAAAPHLEPRVRAVQQQHAALEADFGQILADVGRAGLGGDACRGVAESFRSFAEALLSHEQEEGSILSDAYLDDLGGG